MEQRHRMTIKKLEEIRRRNAAGENDTIIAEALGIGHGLVTYWRRKLGLPVVGSWRPKTRQVIYTVWSAKTDELLACGTAQECANLLGYQSIETFRQMVCRALKGNVKKLYVEKVVEDKHDV